MRSSCLWCRKHQKADSYSFSDEFAQIAAEMELAAWSIGVPR